LLFISLFTIIESSAWPLEAEFQFEDIQNINQVEHDKKNYQFLSIRLKNKGSFSLDSVFSQMINSDHFLFDISELKGKISDQQKKFNLEAGKLFLPWSQLDQDWQLGFLNKRQNFTPFNPEQSGLLLLNPSWSLNKNLQIRLVGSYLNIPEIYPAYYERDGKIHCNSIYCQYELSEVRFNTGKTAEVQYQTENPEIEKILFRPSWGLSLKIVNFDAFYLYKPENRMRFHINTYADPIEQEFLAKIKLNYLQHHLWGANLTYPFWKKISAQASFLEVLPDRSSAQKVSEEYVSIEDLATRQRFTQFKLSWQKKIQLLWLKEWKKEKGNYAFGMAVGELPYWQNALKLILQESFFSDRLELKMIMARDFPFKVDLTSIQSQYNFGRHFYIGAGVDVISARNSNSNWWFYQAEDSFWFRLGARI